MWGKKVKLIEREWLPEGGDGGNREKLVKGYKVLAVSWKRSDW